MKLVVLESPYAGYIERNEIYARLCIKDCLVRGEAPVASHLLYTQDGILNDSMKHERKLGINAGHAWIPVCDHLVVYKDYGISEGMQQGIEVAQRCGRPIEYRKLYTKSPAPDSKPRAETSRPYDADRPRPI